MNKARSDSIRKFLIIFFSILLCGFLSYGLFITLTRHDMLVDKNLEFNAFLLNREIDSLPPQSQWETYKNDAFQVSLKHPRNWTINMNNDNDHIIITWNSVGGTSINLARSPRKKINLDQQIRSILEEGGFKVENMHLIYLRNDFIEVQYLKPLHTAKPKYLLIQSNQIIIITLINYGEWTGNTRNQKFTDAINRALNLIALTINSTDKDSANIAQ